MCDEVLVIKPGENVWCDTVTELAAALGRSCAEISDDPPDSCLCNSKWEALGARRATVAEGFPFPSKIIELQEATDNEH